MLEKQVRRDWEKAKKEDAQRIVEMIASEVLGNELESLNT